MLTEEERQRKYIHLDKKTLENLQNLRKERQQRKISLSKLGQIIGVSKSLVYHYENLLSYPRVGCYRRLVEFFGWNITEDINYQFAVTPVSELKSQLRYRMRRYGLGIRELASILHVHHSMITVTVNMKKETSVSIFAAIVNVFAEEENRLNLVSELIQKSNSKRLRSKKNGKGIERVQSRLPVYA